MKTLLLLALCAVTFNTPSLAQTYYPVEYSFNVQPIAVQSNDPTHIGECEKAWDLAANGYGLWVAGSHFLTAGNVNQAADWRLYENVITGTGTPTYWPATPHGKIESGSGIPFSGSGVNWGETRVVANLNGNVRYVTLKSTLDGFYVRGFDDQQFQGGQAGARKININLPTASPNSISQNASLRHVVYDAANPSSPVIYSFPDVSISVFYAPYGDVGSMPISTAGHFANWDIAIDAHYLYIVWESDNTYSGHTEQEIFLTVLNLTDGTVVKDQNGHDLYPVSFHNRNDLGMQAGFGVSPSIACNVRNNQSGTPSPNCHIAYINTWGLNNGNSGTTAFIHHIAVDGITSTDEQLPDNVYFPYYDRNDPNHIGNVLQYLQPIYARIMCAASPGKYDANDNKTIGYYVLKDDGCSGCANGNYELYFYKENFR